MVLTDAEGRVSAARPGRAVARTSPRPRQLGLVELLVDSPFREILADAGYQGMGAQTCGRVVTPPHHTFKKNAPAWYEERHEQQRKALPSRRIPVEHGIAHLKNWRALARHLGRREHMSDIVQAVAGTALTPADPLCPAAWERESRQDQTPPRATANRARGR
ncbi:transposase family protein [Streptomyces sp. NPDC092370]|uniref:transposase family protein n=1 Tax=Streptomyces sp. NPDC092370 TaxID=3366016 RepID=UPI00381A1CA8